MPLKMIRCIHRGRKDVIKDVRRLAVAAVGLWGGKDGMRLKDYV